MTRSSPVRQSQAVSTPDRRPLSSFLSPDRNNELSHRDALEAAQREHERVREAAIRVIKLHELHEQHQRILEEERKEEARLRAEAKIVAEELRLRELRAKTVPIPKEPEPIPEPAPAPKQQTAPPKPVNPFNNAPPQPSPAAPAPAAVEKKTEVRAPVLANAIQLNGNPPGPAPSKPLAPPQPPAQSNTIQTVNGAVPHPTTTAIQKPVQAPSGQSPNSPEVALAARYTQIHQELKKLRKNLQDFAKTAGPPLKGKLGEFRREIRVSIGQLTAGRGANAQPMNKIQAALKAALEGQVPSPPIDASLFVINPRQPVEGAAHNDATLPTLFIYLMNICAKGIINQYINECGANPKAADPIGVFAAHIFSHKDFQWRGQTLVDILLAKFYKVCPILFGLRGNPRTERGRLAIGWKRDGPGWETEQAHNDRMTGLGAGFASLSLRDFSKTSKTNPYPPSNYWKALARIVNTPNAEVCNTHYVVLRAMVQGHEQRFLNFYGNAGLAALRLALVEFPTKAPSGSTAAASVQALAEVLKAESGLSLA
ncbi:GLE1-like protein-domain-containing protein [Stachybotrys elegans]|uniref:mRNA export factor GLE1 n=1 Tax=Stachybotrys elegans TaxID=80388 RepID=A0A8K0WR73_9HYPO|nr:GLE1-like protein-domain-containing protein [Stachybotrys elegans]